MPRPRKCRRVCGMPEIQVFGPADAEQAVVMTVEEFETIRLIDHLGDTQELCAQQMGVARSTVQSIYNQARRKLAEALVQGKCLRIQGGDYEICERRENCGRHHGCHSCGGRRRKIDGTEEELQMKIAVASEGTQVTGHFGHCANFNIYEVEDQRVTGESSVDNPGHRPGFLPNFLADMGVTVIIAGGIGAHAIEIFADRGVQVVAGASGDAKAAAEAFLRGELKHDGSACHKHHHEHEHHEGQEHGHNCGGHHGA